MNEKRSLHSECSEFASTKTTKAERGEDERKQQGNEGVDEKAI